MLLYQLLRNRYLSPDDAGAGGTAELVEVEIAGAKIPLPKEQATKVIQWRDEQKKSARELSERLGALESAKAAAEQAQRKAAEEAELNSLKNKGQFDEALKRVEGGYQQKLGTLAAKYRDRALEAVIARAPGVIPDAVKDIAVQLAGSCAYDLDSDTLVPMDVAGKPRLGDDGKPLTVDAVVTAFLDQRPYFRQASGSPGSGASGAAKPSPGGPMKMTSAEYEAAIKDPARSQKVAQDLANKRLVIID